jgi:hypothetical protein
MFCQSRGSSEGRYFTGALFLAFGFLLLLGNLDMLDMRSILSRWWPLVLFVIGIKQLAIMRGAAAWVGGLFWIGTGALFLAGTLDYIELSVRNVIWPLMLIWFGVLIALGPGTRYGSERIDDGGKS